MSMLKQTDLAASKMQQEIGSSFYDQRDAYDDGNDSLAATDDDDVDGAQYDLVGRRLNNNFNYI